MKRWISTTAAVGLLMACLAALPQRALAQGGSGTAPAPAVTPLDVKLSLGFQESRGNSRSTTRSAEIDITRQGTRWSLDGEVSVQRGEAQGETHTDQRFADLWLQRRLGKRISVEFGGEAYRNPLAGKTLRTIGGLGLTATLIQRRSWQLSTSAKVGSQAEDLTDNNPDDRFRIYMLEMDGTLSLSSHASLTHEISYRRPAEGDRNEEIVAQLALQSQLTRALAVQVGYNLNYDRSPVPGNESRDSSVNVSLVLDLARHHHP